MGRLEQLKSTKIKELLLRKKLELEEICRSTHLTTQTVFPHEHSIELLESGKVFYLNIKVTYIILHLLYYDFLVRAIILINP